MRRRSEKFHCNRQSGWTALTFWLALECVCTAATLRIGHFPNLTHAQAIYARATGEFEKETGATIQWYSFNAGPSVIEALFTDAVDLSYVGPNPAVNGYLKSKGAKFVIIAGAASGGAGLVVRTDSGIATEQDFSGRTIATPQLGNTQDVAARMWFQERGYRLKEKGGKLTIIALANPDQLTLFKKGQIDGAWTIEPWLSRLEIEGAGRLFLDEKALWPRGRYVTTHLVARREFLDSHEDLVKSLLRGHVRVTQEIQRDPSSAGRLLNSELAKETGKALRPEVVERAIHRIEFTWDPIQESLHRNAASAYAVGFLRKKPNLGGIYELRLLAQVLQQMGLPPLQQ